MMYADKISMAHGLEVRVPFLDKEVVDFAQRLPARFKLRYGQRKWLHRRVCERFLPRRSWRGRSAASRSTWSTSGSTARSASKLSGYLLDDTSRMFAFLKPQAVGSLLDNHRSGRRDNHKILFSLVVLEEWLRANGGPLPPAPPARSATPCPPSQRAEAIAMPASYVLITPARNEVDDIDQTLQSVVAQTARRYDGSSSAMAPPTPPMRSFAAPSPRPRRGGQAIVRACQSNVARARERQRSRAPKATAGQTPLCPRMCGTCLRICRRLYSQAWQPSK